MISFLLCLALLIVGYFVYGKIVDNTFGPDDRETPAVRINDGVDYVVMPQWKLFLVQLLNIAGLGPIFGALQGALWGPVVFLWITFGTIFAGGVHDYFSGMMSERNDGASIAEVQDYVTYWTGVYDCIFFTMNGELYDSLSPELQAIVDECGQKAAQNQREKERAMDEEILAKWEEEGVTVTRLSEEALPSSRRLLLTSMRMRSSWR